MIYLSIAISRLPTCFRDNFVVEQMPATVFVIAAKRSSPTIRTVSPKCSFRISEHSFIDIVDISAKLLK